MLVDEAQDLDLISVRFAASLASEQRNGLTLLGDGQQAVYPGGYTLKEAGLSVVGRSTVLDTNYRNTRQVLAAAQEVLRADEFDDPRAWPSRVGVAAGPSVTGGASSGSSPGTRSRRSWRW